MDTLHSKPLFDDPFRLAVASDHPLAHKQTIAQPDLLNQQMLLLDEGHCLRGQTLQGCQLISVRNNRMSEQQVW